VVVQLVEPDLAVVANWIIEGPTAYDAAYVAIAGQTGAPLITDDREILRGAPNLSRPAAEWDEFSRRIPPGAAWP